MQDLLGAPVKELGGGGFGAVHLHNVVAAVKTVRPLCHMTICLHLPIDLCQLMRQLACTADGMAWL